jgi:hypothetical protein
MFIRKPLYFMADDAASGDAGAGDGGTGDGAAASGASGDAGDQGGNADEGKTFTQADVERIIAGRLAKFGDYDAVKQQLTELQQANQSESEKALNAAKDEGRKEARIEAGEAVALEVFNGAAGRRNADYDTAGALELISLKKFVKDDGTVDRDAITAAVERLVPEKADTKVAPSFGGGARKSDTKADVTPGLGRMRAAYSENTK